MLLAAGVLILPQDVILNLSGCCEKNIVRLLKGCVKTAQRVEIRTLGSSCSVKTEPVTLYIL